MSMTFLVESRSGALVQKAREELLPEDRIVFDGPDAFESSQAAQKLLEAEIEAAGGLDAWKASGQQGA